MQMEKGPFSKLKRGHYGAILIDCPWGYLTRGKGRRLAVPQRAKTQHYPVMSLDELKALPVGLLAAENCSLFMWTFGTFYKQAIELGESWGYRYVTDVFQWPKRTKSGKPTFGLGHWSRRSVETVLLFSLGRPKRLNKGVRQELSGAVREHSQKPDSIYEGVEALVSGPYLEMFARTRRIGWDVWGNDTHRFGISGGKAGRGKFK